MKAIIFRTSGQRVSMRVHLQTCMGPVGSAAAKQADGSCRISSACRNSRFSRFTAFILSATSEGAPEVRFASISAFFTQSLSLWVEQPIFPAIDVTATHREGWR
jgi:hypothetical protein